jgi:hypothetical protein
LKTTDLSYTDSITPKDLSRAFGHLNKMSFLTLNKVNRSFVDGKKKAINKKQHLKIETVVSW